MKNADYNDLKDMVFRMELTYSEIEEILDTKNIATSSTRYTLPTGVRELSDINLMLKSILSNEV